MPKGITQDQVNVAADALVAAGDKPTVERIRAQLGTGSPNTVLRMLEVWRGTLAQRLGQMLVLPDVPSEVGQAFAEVWRLTMTHAESLAQATLVQEQNALLAAQTSLSQERKIWEIAIAEAQLRAQNASQACEVAETRLADLQRLVEQQAGQVAELLQQRDSWQRRAEQLDEAFEANKSAVNAERDAQSLHLRTVEDRAHAEVDRAREEVKAVQATLRRRERETLDVVARLEKALDAARAAEHLAAEQGTRAKTLEQQLVRMDGIPKALIATQRALKAALQRETALQSKLGHRATGTQIQTAVRKRKPRSASGTT
ncbi:MAG: DNA-binding protein [Rhodanobacter sp.]